MRRAVVRSVITMTVAAFAERQFHPESNSMVTAIESSLVVHPTGGTAQRPHEEQAR
jgi:hypothetical protein